MGLTINTLPHTFVLSDNLLAEWKPCLSTEESGFFNGDAALLREWSCTLGEDLFAVGQRDLVDTEIL